MRRRFAVPLIAAAGLAPWFWFLPPPPAPGQIARLDAVIALESAGEWLGGLSGIEVAENGTSFHLVTDRGHRATAQTQRSGTRLDAVEITAWQPILDRYGRAREFPHTDAEGLALDGNGRLYISFEHAHRVLYFDEWDSSARWPSYTRIWRSLSKNAGLEALALDSSGTLFAIPEAILPGAYESAVFRRKPGEGWSIPFTLPVDATYKPVGADFGPDGRLYVLERGIYPFGFFSRVRVMTVAEEAVKDIVTVLETPLGRHGNLEGLAVWRDADGNTRLTMVSDDNFHWFMRGEIVEYVIDGGLANSAE